MKTKFKVNDKVKIASCPIKKYIGKIGVIKKVIPVFDNADQAKESGYIGEYSIKKNDETTTGLYKIDINCRTLPGYALDESLELITQSDPIYTKEFYASPVLTLMIFNTFLKKNLVSEKDMYSSGTFLSMDVVDNKESRKILEVIISDIDAYKKENNEAYLHDEIGKSIGLCLLHEAHLKAHGAEYEIKWNGYEFVIEEDEE